MLYENVFLVEGAGGATFFCDNYHQAVKKIRELVANGDEYPVVNVWWSDIHYEEGRKPSKSWGWREFLMVEHLYVRGVNIRSHNKRTTRSL